MVIIKIITMEKGKEVRHQVKALQKDLEPFILKSEHGIQIISWLDKETFERLARHYDGPCVSIYLPTHDTGMEADEQEDKKAFRSMLQKVQQSMIQQKFDASMAGQLLIPGLQLLNDDDFWRNQSPGLAVFLSPGYGACCQLPTIPEEKIYISTSFRLTPLASILSDTDYAYLLVLTQHTARAYRADRFTLEHIDVPDMPNDNTPLFLAGTDELQSNYRSTSSHKNIAEGSLSGNYEHTDDATLYQLIRPMLEAHFDRQQQETMANLIDQGSRVNSFPQEVIRAAFEGRVAELYIMKGTEVWGHYEPSVNEPILHERAETGDENLADQAVIQTVLHGGKAHLVENMPIPAKLAAVMRY